MHKKFGGDTVGTTDPSWPEGYSIPYDIMLHTKTEGWRLAGSARTFYDSVIL